MKHIMLRTMAAVAILAPCLLAVGEDGLLDLDGRRIVVRVNKNWPRLPRSHEKVTATIKGRTVRPEVADVNSSTAFEIWRQDQNDPVVKQVLEESRYGWIYKDEPEYFLAITSAEVHSREVIVRVYDDSNESMPLFDTRPLKTDGRKLKLDFEDADESTFVAIFGRDQKDEALRYLLGNSLFGWPYKKGLVFKLPTKPVSQEKEQHCWTIADALGAPMPDAELEVYITRGDRNLLIARGTADAQGQFRTCFAATSPLRFVVCAPGYGTAVVEPTPRAGADWLFVPLVPSGSKADERSIWGSVVDPNNKPVSGALIEGSSVTPPGGKRLLDLPDQRHAVITDQQGRFRMYLPLGEDVYQIGTLIPLKAEYGVSIKPPPNSKLAPVTAKIQNAQESKITLDYPGYFHTFVFEGENGPITDPQVLRDIGLYIETAPRTRDAYFGYQKWKDGGRFPLGTYRARTDRFGFQAIEVAADSPEELVFKLPPPRTYYGRVVSGVTGLPMLNALVKAGRQSAHTGEDGSFSLMVPSNDIVSRLVVSKQKYLQTWIIKSWTQKEEDNYYRVPDVRLFPAATVKIHPVAIVKTTHRTILFRPQWYVYTARSPDWAKELVAACGGHPQEGVYRDFKVEAAKDNTFPVPAGVDLRLNLRVLWDIEWAPVTIADGITLQQGEVKDLGEIDIIDPFNIFVEVVNSAGSPVEGVPVVACGDWDPAVSSTDEHGFAFFDFVGCSKGQFIVEYDSDPNTPALREAVPYLIRGPEDANTVYTLQVSDEILYYLFE